MKNNSRNLGLDLMRSLAISFVLISHYGFNPVKKILIGGIGVELFFVLSGFLIGRILIRSFDQYKGFNTIKSFWINRWFRTIPLYYLALIVQIALSKGWNWGYTYYFLFLQSNFFGISLYPISWSLVIEEWFYLGLPLLFGLFQKRIKAQYVQLISLTIISLIIFKFAFIEWKDIPFTGVKGNPLLRFDTMLFGVVLGWLFLKNNKLFVFLSNPVFFTFGFLGVCIINYVFFIQIGIDILNEFVMFKTLFLPVQSLLIAMCLPFLYNSKRLERVLSRNGVIKALIVWTSILSYSFYLFHQNINAFLRGYFSDLDSAIIALVVLYPFSYLLYVIYEKPLTSLREKFNK